MKRTMIFTAWIILPILLLSVIGCGAGNDSGVQVQQQQQQGVATQQSAAAAQQGDGGKQAAKSYYDQQKAQRERVQRGLLMRNKAIQKAQQEQRSNAEKQAQ